jgi:hypothetical protein
METIKGALDRVEASMRSVGVHSAEYMPTCVSNPCRSPVDDAANSSPTTATVNRPSSYLHRLSPEVLSLVLGFLSLPDVEFMGRTGLAHVPLSFYNMGTCVTSKGYTTITPPPPLTLVPPSFCTYAHSSP